MVRNIKLETKLPEGCCNSCHDSIDRGIESPWDCEHSTRCCCCFVCNKKKDEDPKA